jgi:hypothetical protein
VRHPLTGLWSKLMGAAPVPYDVSERDARWSAVEAALADERAKQEAAGGETQGSS